MIENARKMAHFSTTYEKVNKTDSLQPSGSNGPLVYIQINVVSVCLSATAVHRDYVVMLSRPYYQ